MKDNIFLWSGRIGLILIGLLVGHLLTINKAQKTLDQVNEMEVLQNYNAGCNLGLMKGLDWDPQKFQKEYVFCQKVSLEHLQTYKDVSKQMQKLQN